MSNKEIYKLADSITESDIQKALSIWTEEIKETFYSLIKLGDSRELACATSIAEDLNKKSDKDYIKAYTS